MAITCALTTSDEGIQKKIVTILMEAGLRPVSLDQCETVELDSKEAETLAAGLEDFPQLVEMHSFRVIVLDRKLDELLKIMQKAAHRIIPGVASPTSKLVPAEVADFLVWPHTELEVALMDAIFPEAMNIAA